MRHFLILVWILGVWSQLSNAQTAFMQINAEGAVQFVVTDPLGRRCGVDHRAAPTIYDWLWYEEIPNGNYSAQGIGSLDPNDPGVGSMEFVCNLISSEDFGNYLIQVIGVKTGVFHLYAGASGRDTSLTQHALFEMKVIPIDKDSIITFQFTYYSPPGSPAGLAKIVNTNSLLQDLAAMRKLDWIATDAVAEKYRGLVTTYSSHLQQEDSLAAKETLNVFLSELATDSGAAINGDGYRLLRADVEQLISELPSSPPQSPVSPYSLFATHSMHLEQNSKVFSGDVGVNAAGSSPFLDSEVELSVGIGVTTAASSALKAHRIKVKSGATVNSNVYYNELENNGTITGSQNTPLSLPLVAALPEFKQATPGTQNIEVPQNGTQTLPPGTYGDIMVRLKGRLTFTGGTYQINSITGGDDAQFLFQSPTEVRIAGKFDSGEGTTIGPEDTTTMSVDQVIFYVGGINGSNGNLGATPKAAKIGIGNKVHANFYVPNGTLWIRQNSEAKGQFIGKDVDVGIGVKVWR